MEFKMNEVNLETVDVLEETETPGLGAWCPGGGVGFGCGSSGKLGFYC